MVVMTLVMMLVMVIVMLVIMITAVNLAFMMGKCLLKDNSATVGRILMISSADPHEILILIKW